MRNELSLFLTAMMFLTRIPCPSWVAHESDSLAKASKYFPLVGVVVGGLGALTEFSPPQASSL